MSSPRRVTVAARRVVCLHATDPATVFLSAWARVDGFTVRDLERALHDDRSLVKHLAMRRTLFVFPRERLADAQGGASARVAVQERKRLIRFVEEGGLHRDGARWLDTVSAQIRAALADGGARTYAELKREWPGLEGAIQLLERVGRDATRAIAAEATRLTSWLAGVRVLPRFPSPLCRS